VGRFGGHGHVCYADSGPLGTPTSCSSSQGGSWRLVLLFRGTRRRREHRRSSVRSPGTEHLDLACGIRSSVQQAGAGFLAALGGSQSGSQRAQPSGDAERRPATITPGERHIGRHRATSGDWAELIWEQEVAGSNPAIPTIFRICHLSVGANLVASWCRPMSAGWLSVGARWLPPASRIDPLSCWSNLCSIDRERPTSARRRDPLILTAGNATVITSKGAPLRSPCGGVAARSCE
jgi:hypothetical protein